MHTVGQIFSTVGTTSIEKLLNFLTSLCSSAKESEWCVISLTISSKILLLNLDGISKHPRFDQSWLMYIFNLIKM